MIASLLEHWKYTWSDLWSILARSRRAPDDLFVELYLSASDFLKNPREYKQLELIANDPIQAKQAFERIRGQDFGSELAAITFMESAFKTIGDFEIRRYQKLYKRLVKNFLSKYNLRYRVDDPFRLRLVLPGVFAGFYAELGRIHTTDAHLRGLMSDFEQAFENFVRSKQIHDLKTCISKASMYAEGLAGKTHGQNGTLGALCDALKCWPHLTVRDSLKKLYGFCSDYPGIRHAGTPGSRLRELESRDAVVLSMVLVSFSAYLSDEVRVEDILVP